MWWRLENRGTPSGENRCRGVNGLGGAKGESQPQDREGEESGSVPRERELSRTVVAEPGGKRSEARFARREKEEGNQDGISRDTRLRIVVFHILVDVDDLVPRAACATVEFQTEPLSWCNGPWDKTKLKFFEIRESLMSKV